MAKFTDPVRRISFVEVKGDAVEYIEDGIPYHFCKNLTNLEQKKEFLRDLRHEIIRRQLENAIVGVQICVELEGVKAWATPEYIEPEDLDVLTRIFYLNFRVEGKNIGWMP